MQEQHTKKLTDSELRIMEILWKEGACSARHLADALAQTQGWNINSTYTLIRRCIKKGAIAREEPGFVCRALLRCEDVRRAETEKILDRLFDGSADLLFSALLESRSVTPEQLRRMKRQLEALEQEEGPGPDEM